MSRRALTALAAAVAVAGCGGPSERDAVRDYIDDANAIQSAGQQDTEALGRAYRRLSRGRLSGVVAITELQDAGVRLRDTRRRLASLDAPEDATALRDRLLDVYDRNAALADETARLGAYLPAARRAAASLTRFGARLRRDLADAADPAAQEAALERYAQRLGALEARQRRLDPPEVLLAEHRAQLLRLSQAQALTDDLRSAIDRRDSATVTRLLLRFESVYDASKVDRGVQRRAVQAYRERLQALSAAVGRVRLEQGRLEKSLG